MKISLGCDHGGFKLKEEIKKALINEDIEVIDCGCFSEERVDYPVFAKKVCENVEKKECDYGVLVCTTGIGMSIVANKYKGIRAALVTNIESAHLTRQHNDSNIICLSQKFTETKDAIEYVLTFISEKFIYGRHENRIKMIEEVEENERKTNSI